MPAVDTNVVVRWLTADDSEQTLSATTLLERGGVWISKTVLLETEWVLRGVYGFPRVAVHTGFARLFGLPGIEIEDPQAVDSALMWFEAGMDFADALHLASCPERTEFATFDGALVRRARKLGMSHVTSLI